MDKCRGVEQKMIKRFITSVELPEQLHTALCTIADRMGCRKSDIIRWAVKDYVEFLTEAWPVHHQDPDQDNETREVIICGKKDE